MPRDLHNAIVQDGSPQKQFSALCLTFCPSNVFLSGFLDELLQYGARDIADLGRRRLRALLRVGIQTGKIVLTRWPVNPCKRSIDH